MIKTQVRVGLPWWVALTLLFWLMYALFAWQRGPVLIARHASAGVAPAKASPEVRVAYAQRLAERAAGGLNPNDPLRPELRRLLLAETPANTNEVLPTGVTEGAETAAVDGLPNETTAADLAWYAAYGVAIGERQTSEELALAAVAKFSLAETRFLQFPRDEQVASLQSLLLAQDLDRDAEAWRASRLVGWLGGYGTWAERPYPSRAGETPPPPLFLATERLDESTAREIAAACLRKYRGREYPGTLERALFQWGPAAVEPLVAELELALAGESHFSQRIALYRALQRLGPTAQPAAPLLVRSIEQERVNLALQAALLAIIAIEPTDRVAAAAAIRAANDPERWQDSPYDFATIRRGCIAALEAVGDPLVVEQLIEELGGKRPNRVGVMAAAIDLPDSWRLVRKLGNLGEVARPATELLQRGLASVATEVRIESALALHRVGVESPDAVPELLACLDRRQHPPDDVGLALLALSEIGWPADRPPDELLELLRRGPSPEIRQLAAELLQRTFAEEPAVTEAFLAAVLAESEARTRQVILERLEQRLVSQYAQNLEQTTLGDAIEWLRQHGGRPPSAWSGPEALQVLLAKQAIFEEPDAGAMALAAWLAMDPDFPVLAGEWFDNLGDGRQAALPQLVRGLSAADSRIVTNALERMRRMGPLAADAFVAVERSSADGAMETLRAIDPRAYLASTRRDLEWLALCGLPFLGLGGLGLCFFGGWRRS